MSNLFYNYLSKRIIEYFKLKTCKSGDKFSIQFEKEEQVKQLYETLKESEEVRDFYYKSENASIIYNTYELCVEGAKVIVAATIYGVKPDFLTLLRNKVGVEEDIQFRNKAILFIHNTNLDSIINGTESFEREGMPFHVDSILKDIGQELKKSKLSRRDKFIINFDLGKKKNQIFEDNKSLFEYEDLLKVLDKGYIDKEQYRDFGLFYDDELIQNNDNDTIKRLEDNYTSFSKVDVIHRYGDPDEELEKVFDEKGVEELGDPNWKDVIYKNVRNSIENKKNSKPIEYEKCNVLQGLELWERSEGTTKVKSRVKNIIIFNSKKINRFTIEFNFDRSIKNQYVSLNTKYGKRAAVVKAVGKKIVAEILHTVGTTTFEKVNYKDNDNVKYEFKIAVIECNQNILENIKTNYNVIVNKESFILCNIESDEISFNNDGTQIIRETISNSCCDFKLSDNEKLILTKNIEDDTEESEYIKFNIRFNSSSINLAIKESTGKPEVITGLKVWEMKREKSESFKYMGENKLVQGTEEFYARDEFRKNLELEKIIIEKSALYCTQIGEEVECQDLTIDDKLKQAYLSLIEYYKVNETLPSLTYYNKEIVSLCENYVEEYLRVLSTLDGEYINRSQKNLIKIGSIKKLDGEKEIMFTPMHPLSVAYQLILNEKIKNETIFSDEVLKKLTPAYLLPFMYDNEELYKTVEQNHSPEWIYFVSYKMPRYKGSRNFVSKLVREKIEEFVEHFKYLFELTAKSPIKINLINVGDCKEVMQGIFEYYTRKLKKNPNIDKLLPIEICIYDEGNPSNVFEQISFYNDIDEIKSTFGVNLKNEIYSEEDVLNIFRNKVSFFRRSKTDSEYKYAHISFYEMDSDIKETGSSKIDINTGVSLNGVISGLPSMHLGDLYRTGFGEKYMSDENNVLLKIASKLNSLARAIKSEEKFNDEKGISTAISEDKKLELDRVYDCSHWVTFIEPKVDLNFFKNNLSSKNLLIIHYSDQYTTSSGYDAITVTRKSKQYQLIIEEFLREKEIENSELHSVQVIDFFNAINGDWLLKLISSKSESPREKLSILSAIKLSLAYFHTTNIIWVPISLEEVLRVSSGAGLSQSGGLLSAKNLGGKGKFSDDILLIGIENTNNNIKVYLYPIEVKIGKNEENVINKAVEQVTKTKCLLTKIFADDIKDNTKFLRTLYRNFLMQLVIISAEKMKLYRIWEEEDWDSITNSEVRKKLLNDEFEVSNKLDKYIKGGAVVSFKDGIYFYDPPKIRDDILILQFSEEDGYKNVISDVEKLKNKFINGESDFDKDKLLYYMYNPLNDKNPSKVYNNLKGEQKIENKESELESRTITANSKILEITFGTNMITNEPVVWYPTDTNQISHTNTGIIGTMGTGKTQFTKSLIAQLSKNEKYNVDGRPIGILIFDYKGDYIDKEFKDATKATVYDIYKLPYNPLALFVTDGSKPLLPIHTANMVKETLSNAFGLGVKQQNTLRDIIMESYDKRGIKKNDRTTWQNSAPTLNDVCNLYYENENIKEDSLYAALSNISDFEIFEEDPKKTKSLFDIINGVTVINLSGYDESIQNLVVAITLDIFYTQMIINGESRIENSQYRQLTKMILVDEADNFLSKNFKSLKKILKEGRMFGVGTILSTQLLSHFSTSDNDYANYIMTWIVHNVSDLNSKDVRYIFNTQSKSEDDNIYNKIKSLAKHHSLVKLPNENKPLYIKDLAFWELEK